MTPQEYAAWISSGAFAAEKDAKERRNEILTRLNLQSWGWDDAMIAQHLDKSKQNLSKPPALGNKDREDFLKFFDM